MSYTPEDATARQVNPYAAPPSDTPLVRIDLEPRATSSRRSTMAQWLSAVMMISALVAAAIAVWDIESIVVSGAIFAVAAITLMALAYARPLRPLMLIGAATLLFALGCFLTIWGMSWSPQQAQWPIGTACAVFALFIHSGWQALWIVRRAALPQETDDPASTAEPGEPLPYG